MGEESGGLQGANFTAGVREDVLEEGIPFLGHADGEAVIIVRRGAELFATGERCTHYGGPLHEGLVVGEEIRCPWHHACFSLRTGEVTAAPALNPLPRWETTRRDGMVYVTRKLDDADVLHAVSHPALEVRRVVIIGGGAAGTAVAEGLRRGGYEGSVIIVDPDADAPYDRPNLSKDYLAGTAQEEWLPLRPDGFLAGHGIERILDRVGAMDTAAKTVAISNGKTLSYDALVIATGAVPLRPPIPGADLPHVHVLRTLADCRALIEKSKSTQRVLIAGASFIGMEAAASLRHRGMHVTIAAPELVPFSQVLGPTIGTAMKKLHEEHGVEFRLGHTVEKITRNAVTLDDGSTVDADLVLLGIGVRPDLSLPRDAGLTVDRGVVVDEFLQTGIPGIYAAGDIAQFRDTRSGEDVRIEHWVVAQRQGAAVAANILGPRAPFTSVPFFWTTQYDVTVNYVGHATDWTHIVVDGSPEARDCGVAFMSGDTLLAYVTIGRDLESLEMERKLAGDTHDDPSTR
jgi:apoptosis-inducing factor 3